MNAKLSSLVDGNSMERLWIDPSANFRKEEFPNSGWDWDSGWDWAPSLFANEFEWLGHFYPSDFSHEALLPG